MIPFIASSEGTYTRATAIAWSDLESPLCRALDDRVASGLARLSSAEDTTPLLVDCCDVLRVEDHAFDAPLSIEEKRSAKEVIRASKRAVLFCMKDGLEAEVENGLGRASATYSEGDDVILLYGDHHMSREDALLQDSNMHELLTSRVQSWIGSCFQKWAKYQRLPSTPLLANGCFDARRILVDPERFLWTSVAMRDLVSQFIPDLRPQAELGFDARSVPSGISLLTVSLRASAFGAAIAILLGEYFVSTLSVVDHAGPQRRIFDRNALEEWPENSNFLLVSDFIVGGSELRAAEALADFRGGRLIGAIALGTALDGSEYNTLCGVASLTKLTDCCPDFSCTFLAGGGH